MFDKKPRFWHLFGALTFAGIIGFCLWISYIWIESERALSITQNMIVKVNEPPMKSHDCEPSTGTGLSDEVMSRLLIPNGEGCISVEKSLERDLHGRYLWVRVINYCDTNFRRVEVEFSLYHGVMDIPINGSPNEYYLKDARWLGTVCHRIDGLKSNDGEIFLIRISDNRVDTIKLKKIVWR